MRSICLTGVLLCILFAVVSYKAQAASPAGGTSNGTANSSETPSSPSPPVPLTSQMTISLSLTAVTPAQQPVQTSTRSNIPSSVDVLQDRVTEMLNNMKKKQNLEMKEVYYSIGNDQNGAWKLHVNQWNSKSLAVNVQLPRTLEGVSCRVYEVDQNNTRGANEVVLKMENSPSALHTSKGRWFNTVEGNLTTIVAATIADQRKITLNGAMNTLLLCLMKHKNSKTMLSLTTSGGSTKFPLSHETLAIECDGPTENGPAFVKAIARSNNDEAQDAHRIALARAALAREETEREIAKMKNTKMSGVLYWWTANICVIVCYLVVKGLLGDWLSRIKTKLSGSKEPQTEQTQTSVVNPPICD